MTCAELKELAGALAVGALEPAERAACEAHLAQPGAHEGCAEAVRRAGEAALLLAAALPEAAPGEGVWRAVEARIGSVPAAPIREPRLERRWFGGWLVAAAAVAAMAVLWFVDHGELTAEAGRREAELATLEGKMAALDGAAASCRKDLALALRDSHEREEALSMLQQSTTAVVALAPQGGVPMHASALYDRASRHAMVVASGLAVHPGKDYELWVIRGDHKMPAGILHGDVAGTAVAHVDQKLFADGSPDAFAVTLEPAGGGPKPRGPIMLVGTLSKG
ncbi:MAG TPA: anti-sigma factor [Myxococcales bacterium]|nr:anti-sigma factor [Myxococcales bacterium]